MKTMIEVQVKCFGAFRNIAAEVKLEVQEGATVLTLRKELETRLKKINPSFDGAALMTRSVLADENSVLEDSVFIQKGMRLAILPPVSGG